MTRFGFAWVPAAFAVIAVGGAATLPRVDESSACHAAFDEASTNSTAHTLAVSATRIGSRGTYLYQSGFDLSRSSGNLRRFRLMSELSDTNGIADAVEWDAAEILTGTDTSVPAREEQARHIYTAKKWGSHALATIEFKWENLAREQQRHLDVSPDSGKRDNNGSRRVAYLRGARNLEIGRPGGIFRARSNLLGDIVNSNPVYVGTPALDIRGKGYSEFHERYKDRTPAVYVGANDGMLHSFDAGNGAELFAYVPNVLMPKLGQLTSPGYEHQSFVDGGMDVSETTIDGHWRTVLAASMGKGAKGVFALDVTDPADFARGLGALWEFTDADDPDMAEASRPVIGRFRTDDVKGVPQYHDFVVVASGTTSDGGAGGHESDARGVLFLLALDKPATENWHLGVNYYKFKVPATGNMRSDRLSAPAFATDRDGAVRYAYAGDLQGNLWRFDFTGSIPWAKAIDASSDPLFVAKDSRDMRQPIVARPRVVFAPGGGYVVLFGTGRLAQSKDSVSGDFGVQSFYAIFDTARARDRVTGREQLIPRHATLDESGKDVSILGAEFAYGANAPDKRGWYLDFPESGKTGERNVTDSLIAFGRIFFNTLVSNGDSCATANGRSYALDALTGLPANGASTGESISGNILGSPVLIAADRAEISGRHATGNWMVTNKYAVFSSGTAGGRSVATPIATGIGEARLPAGRLSWREIANWQDMRLTASSR